jgi:hypothetical protein
MPVIVQTKDHQRWLDPDNYRREQEDRRAAAAQRERSPAQAELRAQ